jgi:hypothetical protein
MRLHYKKTVCLIVVCYCTIVQLLAQQYAYKAPIDSVKKTGFYAVAITPALSAYIKTDVADIRITNAKGQWVPHIVNSNTTDFNVQNFIPFSILSNETNDTGKSILILEAPQQNILSAAKQRDNNSEIVLFIKNTLANRYVNLSGSYNNKKWYSIIEQEALAGKRDTGGDYFISTLQIGNNDYTYFKLVIDNKKQDPLNIFKAGIYTPPALVAATFTDNPAVSFVQTDSSDGKTYIAVKQGAPFHINAITITTNGTRFYKRSAALYLPQHDSTTIMQYQPHASFILSSITNNTFNIDKCNPKMFYVVIENNDNPPLKIENITVRQQNASITTYLEEGQSYFLLAGNAQAQQPDYDIASFKDSIPRNITAINIGDIKAVTTENIITPAPVKKWWLWPAIIAAIVVLAMLTFKLLADMRKQNM